MDHWTHYFAYGSNLSLAQMGRRCPDHQIIGKAVATGWKLEFPLYSKNWNSGVANIVNCNQSVAEGVVYALSPEEEYIMDGYEIGYTKGKIDVQLSTGQWINAMSYFAIPCKKGPYPPNEQYLNTMLAGGQDHALSEQWHQHINQLLKLC